MKKILIAVMAPAAVLAADGDTPAMDTTAAANMVKASQEGLTDLLTTVQPYITTLLLAGLAIWAAIRIIVLVKRVFSRAS